MLFEIVIVVVFSFICLVQKYILSNARNRFDRVYLPKPNVSQDIDQVLTLTTGMSPLSSTKILLKSCYFKVVSGVHMKRKCFNELEDKLLKNNIFIEAVEHVVCDTNPITNLNISLLSPTADDNDFIDNIILIKKNHPEIQSVILPFTANISIDKCHKILFKDFKNNTESMKLLVNNNNFVTVNFNIK